MSARESHAANPRDRGTTSAIAPDGQTIYFDDLVRDGEKVEVRGHGLMVIRYDPDAPDWFVEPRSAAPVDDSDFLRRLRELAEDWRTSDEFIGIVVRGRYPINYDPPKVKS